MDNLALDLVVFSSSRTITHANQWVENLRSSGFHVHLVETSSPIPCLDLHIPKQLSSKVCAITKNPTRYVLSGYVPAETISQMLREKPGFYGIAAPDSNASSDDLASPTESRQLIWGFWTNGHHELFAVPGRSRL
ncbi:MAG: hypothetical protein HRU81_04425 [Gammaproteobacteria bacterium]|nr:MAG: hypothetical protein HRU81_04425 [Gammaproteobacteria bacterium]